MASAYIIAFIDKDTEVINKIDILSDPTPTVTNIMTMETNILYETTANTYHYASIIANDRLKEILQFASTYEHTPEISNENTHDTDLYDATVDAYIIVYETTYSKTIRGLKITSDLSKETPPYGSRIKVIYTVTSYDNETAISLANKRLKEIASCAKIENENNCIIL